MVELDRPTRTARGHGAKSDPLDATRAAREALGRDQLAQPRAAGYRAALAVRLAARRAAVQATTDAQRQLHALVAAPDSLRSRLRELTTPRLVSTCGRLRLPTAWDVETIATAASLRALARRIHLLGAEVADHPRAITTLVRAWHSELRTPMGWARSWLRWCCVAGPIPVAGGPMPPSPCGRGRPDPGLLRPTGPGAAASLRRPSPQPGLHVVVLTRLGYDPATRA